jgi:hypothetical protein
MALWIVLILGVVMMIGCNDGATVQRLHDKECSELATGEVKKAIVDNDAVRGTIIDLKSRFVLSRNTCIVHVEYQATIFKGPSWSSNVSIFSIDKHRQIDEQANYSEIHYEESNLPKQTEISGCEVGDRKCSTKAEFNELIRPYEP